MTGAVPAPAVTRTVPVRRLETARHLLTSGLRVGELLALRWVDVDLGAARMTIRHAVVGVPYSAIKPAPIARRAREVELDPRTVALLHEHRDYQGAERAEWGNEYRDRDLVICQPNGELIHPRSLNRALGSGIEPPRSRANNLGEVRS